MNRKSLHTADYYFHSFQKKEEEGFTHLFNAWYEALVYYAFAIVKQRETAEDLVENAFVKLWQSNETFDSATNLKKYLYFILHNACIDVLRREKVKALSQNELKMIAPTVIPSHFDKVVWAEALARVHKTLESLPPNYATIFRKYYYEQKSLQQIAEEMGLSISTVKANKGKALNLLRNSLPPGLFYLIINTFS